MLVETTEVLLVTFEVVPVTDVLRLGILVGVLTGMMTEELLVVFGVEIDTDVVRMGVLVAIGKEVLKTLLAVLDTLLRIPAAEEAAQFIGASLFNCS